MPLPLSLSFLVVPRLISVWVSLPDVLQERIDQSFTDQNAEVHNQVGVHRPAGYTVKRRSQTHTVYAESFMDLM